MCQKSIRASPFDVLSHVGPRLVPFFKTVIIYFVAWLPLDYPTVFSALIKCLPIMCLTFFVWLQGVSLRKEHDYQRRILVGLVFSCLGDALLIWHETHFITAMAAFAVAHVSYIRAFGFSRPYKWVKGIPFVGLLLFVMYLFYPGLQGILLPGVYIYIWIICSMGWRAVAQIDLENTWSWTSLFGCIGAVLFMLSDLIIGINKFVTPVPLSRVLIMSTYYAAQVFIALSAVNTTNIVIKLRMSNKAPQENQSK